MTAKLNKPNIRCPFTRDLNELRNRLRAMSNKQLREFGTYARLNYEQLNADDLSRVEFAIDFEEAQTEWRDRHPKKSKHSQKPKAMTAAT